MKQEILTRFPWPWMPVLALMIFFLFFAGLLIRVSLRSQRSVFEKAEQLPLEEGERT